MSTPRKISETNQWRFQGVLCQFWAGSNRDNVQFRCLGSEAKWELNFLFRFQATIAKEMKMATQHVFFGKKIISFSQAIRNLQQSTTRRLIRLGTLQDYVPEEQTEDFVHYIPHQVICQRRSWVDHAENRLWLFNLTKCKINFIEDWPTIATFSFWYPLEILYEEIQHFG